MKNFKKLLNLTDAILAKTDPFLLKMAHVGVKLTKESNSGKRFQEYSGIFSEYTDYYLDSETLLDYLKELRQKFIRTTKEVDNSLNRLLSKKHTLNYQKQVYTSLKSILQKFSDYRILRIKMYQ